MSAFTTRRSGRPTWAEIDLDRIAGNVAATMSIVGPDVRVMAVVKADAYGHGASWVGRAAIGAGAAELAVATVDEGTELRRAGLTAPILVLGPISPGEVETALDQRLTLTIASPDFLRLVATVATSGNRGPATVHLKLDSGMRRFGATEGDFVATARLAADLPSLRLGGVYTHLADADDQDSHFVAEQVATFTRALHRLTEDAVPFGTVHVANSAGIFRSLDVPVEMVRLGVALYGIAPAAGQPLPLGYAPAMSIRSTVSRLVPLAAGDTVGYGRTYQAETPGVAALVPIGYADGFPRALSNVGEMAIGGTRVPVLGRVSMDQTVVGLPPGGRTTVGTVVDVVGTGERGEPTFASVAELLGTIAYELVTGISRRVPRDYLAGGRVVGSRTLAGDQERKGLGT